MLKIREIVRLQTLRPLPQGPAFIKGVLDVHGLSVLVVDLRGSSDPGGKNTEQTCVLIIELDSLAERQIVLGVIVEGLDQVLNLSPEEIASAPDYTPMPRAARHECAARIKCAVQVLVRNQICPRNHNG